MTLAELIIEAKKAGRNFTTAWIPLKLDGHDVEIGFDPKGSYDEGYVINIRIRKIQGLGSVLKAD